MYSHWQVGQKVLSAKLVRGGSNNSTDYKGQSWETFKSPYREGELMSADGEEIVESFGLLQLHKENIPMY